MGHLHLPSLHTDDNPSNKVIQDYHWEYSFWGSYYVGGTSYPHGQSENIVSGKGIFHVFEEDLTNRHDSGSQITTYQIIMGGMPLRIGIIFLATRM